MWQRRTRSTPFTAGCMLVVKRLGQTLATAPHPSLSAWLQMARSWRYRLPGSARLLVLLPRPPMRRVPNACAWLPVRLRSNAPPLPMLCTEFAVLPLIVCILAVLTRRLQQHRAAPPKRMEQMFASIHPSMHISACVFCAQHQLCLQRVR